MTRQEGEPKNKERKGSVGDEIIEHCSSNGSGPPVTFGTAPLLRKMGGLGLTDHIAEAKGVR